MAADPGLAAARAFLAPILRRDAITKVRGQSIVERLVADCHTQPANPRVFVIGNALELLLAIHSALLQSYDSGANREFLFNSSNRRIIDALLDLISLEGIYPNLLQGVGVPIERRVKAIFQAGVATRTADGSVGVDFNRTLLLEIVSQLNKIATDSGGLHNALQDRTLVDLIAASGQLEFEPTDQQGLRHHVSVNELLSHVPANILFPILTSLLHPGIPSWLKIPLSTELSLLPLRSDGVRQTIYFIAETTSQAPEDANYHAVSTLPTLSLETLGHASKLLSSVPSTMNANEYFSTLAPQLFALLDGEDGDMRRAASYIIGTGILGRRQYGAFGSPGWKIFAEPIINALVPEVESKTSDQETTLVLSRVIVSSDILRIALFRLAALLLTYPNPGLVKRMVSPVKLSIWNLLCLSYETAKGSAYYRISSELLAVYMKHSAGLEGLVWLIDNLNVTGDAWKYSSNGTDGIEIQRTGSAREIDFAALEHTFRLRTKVFMMLLDSTADDTEISNVFLHLTGRWLIGSENQNQTSKLDGGENPENNPLGQAVYAGLAGVMLDEHGEKIAKSPDKFIELVQQLIKAFLQEDQRVQELQAKRNQPSLTSLGSILNTLADENEGTSSGTKHLNEVVCLALNILTHVLISADLALQSSTSELLASLQNTLSNLRAIATRCSVSMSYNISFVSSLITNLLSSDLPYLDQTTSTPSSDPRDVSIHTLALKNITSSFPPVRAQGLSALQELIEDSSPILDIPTTTILLLSLLQDNEEFNFLYAIRTLTSLTILHPRTTIPLLLERYIDPSEEGGLDFRIRIGEALVVTAEKLYGPTATEVVQSIGQSMITVAGRRGQRPKTAEAREKNARFEQLKRLKAQTTWEGGTPHVDEEYDEAEDHIANVLAGWEGQGFAEDIRIRASAASILSVTLKANLAAMGPVLTSTAVDLALAILRMEKGPEHAILRRAAALVVMGLVKAIDKAEEEERNVGFGLQGEGLIEVLQVLRWVRDEDEDEIVNSHVRDCVEGLEAVQQKGLWRAIGGPGVKVGLEGRLRGLDINPDEGESGVKKVSIEEVE